MKYFRLYMNFGKVLMVKTKHGTNCIPKVIIVLLENTTPNYTNECNLKNLISYQEYNLKNNPFYSFNLYTTSVRNIKFDKDSTLLHIGFIDQIIEKFQRDIEYEKHKK